MPLTTVAGFCEVICTRTLRRRNNVGGGATANFALRRRAAGPKKSALAVKFSNFAYLLQQLFSNELLLPGYAC